MELTSTEKDLILQLAEKGPLSGYQIHTKKPTIMANSYWEKVKRKLGDKGLNLIFEVKTEGSAKPYWLTFEGVKYAIIYGAEVDKMKAHAKNVYEGKDLEEFNAVADLEMFPREILLAQSFKKGVNFMSLTKILEKTVKVFPRYLEAHPELEHELREKISNWDLFKDIILDLSKKELKNGI
jgi:hypothetical protein